MTIPMQWALRRRMMMSALSSSIDISALSITYTGAHTDYGMVTMSDGARYRLLAFTSSGTLSIEQPVNCEVCVVGGGANGGSAGGAGGAGGYLKNQAITKYNGGAVVVGAAQAASSVGEVSVEAVSGKNGGTGGGGGAGGSGGVGDGIKKFPFGDETYSLWGGMRHCGGGGGGAIGSDYGAFEGAYDGGNGGTNGGSGAESEYIGLGRSGSGGSGGPYGGAYGASASDIELENGYNATYYGSGGGGGAKYYYEYAENMHDVTSDGGSGYQGIVYMRIPEEPPAYISDLALGALINIGTDGGNGAANYEIADINNLVPGGVVLVRKNIHSKSAFNSSYVYPDGTLDNLIKTTIYNKMPQKLRDKMMDVTFPLYNSGNITNITRKMFALTCTMAGFGNNYDVAEGKALQLYTSQASRIKTLNGSADYWWLSSWDSSSMGGVWLVAAKGWAGRRSASQTSGVVPAFVIPSETRYDATPNTDGSYNLIL